MPDTLSNPELRGPNDTPSDTQRQNVDHSMSATHTVYILRNLKFYAKDVSGAISFYLYIAVQYNIYIQRM